MLKSFSLPKSLPLRILPKVAVLCFLLLLVGIAAVPGYLSGNWSWAKVPAVTNLKQLKELRQTGLELPGWKTLDHKIELVGSHKWSIQEIDRDNPKPVRLLLLPQNDHKAQPEIEWVDVKEFEHWQTDSYKKMQFAVESSQLQTGVSKPATPAAEVEARFFRAWNQRQTVAVLQWYAMSGGGHPAPSRWFWADQFAQWRRSRVPWVAVCLQLPIEPLGDIEAARPLAESLGKMVQTALMAGPLGRASSAQ
jgi:cyanoexosortase B-associated protein